MKAVVETLNGQRGTVSFDGNNFTLGLGGTLHQCPCGVSEFVDASTDDPPDERDPDRFCDCGLKYWYYDDESDHAGFLTNEAIQPSSTNSTTTPHEGETP